MKKSQKQKLLELLQDGQEHRTDEICEMVYGGSHLGLTRVGARIWDLKNDGKNIIGHRDENTPSLYWYKLIVPESYKEQSSLPITLSSVYINT